MKSLLLAGGRSKRMGQDKALIEIDGKAMITRVVEALKKADREPIRIAVANPEKMEEYAEVIGSDYDIEWVLDSIQHAGPVDSIIENLFSNGLGINVALKPCFSAIVLTINLKKVCLSAVTKQSS